MDWYEPEVRALESATTQGKLPHDPVVFYGSSTIRLWNTLASDLNNSRALNLGFGGSTLSACVHFFERLVPPVDPCSLVIYAGDNDLGDGRRPEEVAGTFQALSEKVTQSLNGIPMAFISIKPSPARAGIMDRIRAANEMVKDVVAKRKASYYIDVFDAMLTPDGKPRTELFTPDGLHMNEKGYRLWTQLLSPFRNRIFTTDCSCVKAPCLS